MKGFPWYSPRILILILMKEMTMGSLLEAVLVTIVVEGGKILVDEIKDAFDE